MSIDGIRCVRRYQKLGRVRGGGGGGAGGAVTNFEVMFEMFYKFRVGEGGGSDSVPMPQLPMYSIVQYSTVQYSTAEQSRAEQSRAEQSRAYIYISN